jgi:DNA-binding response OmpR family regulator
MTENHTQILCVGNEPDLLELRCSILEQAGYACEAARLNQADTLLKDGRFDLVIISARISEYEKRHVISLAPNTRLLFLSGVTFPRDLLRDVSDLIGSRAPRISRLGA